MGPGQKFLNQSWAGQPTPNLEIFPSKSQIFQIFLHSDKKNYLYQSWASPFFTTGQDYAWDGSGQGPSL